MCYVFIKLAEIILCTKSETIDQGQVKPLISLTKFKMIKKGISKCHYYVSNLIEGRDEQALNLVCLI